VRYQLIATLPNGQQKSILNRDEESTLDHVAEFVRDSTITTRWANKTQTRQALELRVYQTSESYDKRSHGKLEDFLKRKRNVFARFEKEALEKRIPQRKTRVFVVMPIQGEEYGSQSEQAIFKEFNDRFAVIEQTLQDFDCVAIRIDREQPLEGMVQRIKDEIRRARFVVADLTDERPSCYFEVGYAEALGKPVIPVASKQSIMEPGKNTKIHFDIHQNVRFFTNHKQLAEKLREAVEKNRKLLVDPPEELAAQRNVELLTALYATTEQQLRLPLRSSAWIPVDR
jgi:nucleoside 2-deoxyribosyltransferase